MKQARQIRCDAREGLTLAAFAGLQMLRGNKAPYFTLTGELRNRYGRIEACGMLHDDILKRWPELLPLARLHCSTIYGEPMHAAENAIFWAAGVLGGDNPLGQRYHGGNGSNGRDGAECLRILSDHLRIDEKAARELVGDLERAHKLGGRERLVWFVNLYVDQQRPRWKREADEAITKFGLEVFGDPWTAPQAS